MWNAIFVGVSAIFVRFFIEIGARWAAILPIGVVLFLLGFSQVPRRGVVGKFDREKKRGLRMSRLGIAVGVGGIALVLGTPLLRVTLGGVAALSVAWILALLLEYEDGAEIFPWGWRAALLLSIAVVVVQNWGISRQIFTMFAARVAGFFSFLEFGVKTLVGRKLAKNRPRREKLDEDWEKIEEKSGVKKERIGEFFLAWVAVVVGALFVRLSVERAIFLSFLLFAGILVIFWWGKNVEAVTPRAARDLRVEQILAGKNIREVDRLESRIQRRGRRKGELEKLLKKSKLFLQFFPIFLLGVTLESLFPRGLIGLPWDNQILYRGILVFFLGTSVLQKIVGIGGLVQKIAFFGGIHFSFYLFLFWFFREDAWSLAAMGFAWSLVNAVLLLVVRKTVADFLSGSEVRVRFSSILVTVGLNIFLLLELGLSTAVFLSVVVFLCGVLGIILYYSFVDARARRGTPLDR